MLATAKAKALSPIVTCLILVFITLLLSDFSKQQRLEFCKFPPAINELLLRSPVSLLLTLQPWHNIRLSGGSERIFGTRSSF